MQSLHSPWCLDEVERAADSKAQVDNRGKDGKAEVVADTDVNLPALPYLVHPVRHQPGDDDQHADSDEELNKKQGANDEIVTRLRPRARKTPHRMHAWC